MILNTLKLCRGLSVIRITGSFYTQLHSAIVLFHRTIVSIIIQQHIIRKFTGHGINSTFFRVFLSGARFDCGDGGCGWDRQVPSHTQLQQLSPPPQLGRPLLCLRHWWVTTCILFTLKSVCFPWYLWTFHMRFQIFLRAIPWFCELWETRSHCARFSTAPTGSMVSDVTAFTTC